MHRSHPCFVTIADRRKSTNGYHVHGLPYRRLSEVRKQLSVRPPVRPDLQHSRRLQEVWRGSTIIGGLDLGYVK